ncbi:MAG: hypothetical protein SGPRY_002110 [Prymnesium sp.]
MSDVPPYYYYYYYALCNKTTDCDRSLVPLLTVTYRFATTRMVPTRYTDIDGNFLHAGDLVSFPRRPSLAGQRGSISSFYLKRDASYRATVLLLGASTRRTLGVLTTELRKLVAEGPEPASEACELWDPPLLAALSSTHSSLRSCLDQTVDLIGRALSELAVAMRRWPPPLESREEEPLSSLASSLQHSALSLSSSLAPAEVEPVLSRVKEASTHAVGALGCFALLYADDTGCERPAHMRQIDASSRLQELMGSVPRCLDAVRRAARRRAESMRVLHSLRRHLASVKQAARSEQSNRPSLA